MAKASNRVLAGDYAKKQITCSFGIVQIITGFGKGISIDNSTIDSYELITDEHRKSAASGVARGLVGGHYWDLSGCWQVVYLQKVKVYIKLLFNLKMGKNRLLRWMIKYIKSLLKIVFNILEYYAHKEGYTI